MKRIALLAVSVIALLTMASCAPGESSSPAPENTNQSEEGTQMPENTTNPHVTIEMTDGSKIVLELYPDKAPNTVLNFLDLVNQGFYDGLIFHRVSPGFMIQGGCPEGSGSGGPGYNIKGEFTENGFEGNDLSHTEGVISMARATPMDSAGCQFFICDGDASFLDGQYAAFGKVIEGMDAVKKIANQTWSVQLDQSSGRPAEDQVMKKVTVDTFGAEFPKPEVIK